MLENGAIDNPVLMSAFEFIKNVSELEQHYLILNCFCKFLCLKTTFFVYEILKYFIFIYRLVMHARLVFRPKFVNLMDLILALRICYRVYMFIMCLLLWI